MGEINHRAEKNAHGCKRDDETVQAGFDNQRTIDRAERRAKKCPSPRRKAAAGLRRLVPATPLWVD